MKSESIQIVEMLFRNPLDILMFDEPQVYENMTVIPIIVKGKFLDFISVKEAEEADLISIQETDTVSQLEVINKSDKQVLIPFGVTVHGGKQDRTIWEPILLPVGGKQSIFNKAKGVSEQSYTVPAKCVEQSRWQYRKGRGFKSAKTRLHPNVAYEAISSSGQSNVWNEIQSYRTEMNYAMNVAPTQSYLEMTENIEKKTDKIITSFTNVENQCGIAVFINNEFIGLEFYSNPNAWKYMSEDILKAFSIEAIRFKDKWNKTNSGHYEELLIKGLKGLRMEFSVRKGISLGDVVEFESQDKIWRGNTLVHDTSMAQFYFVSKRGGSKSVNQRNMAFQTVINQRYEV